MRTMTLSAIVVVAVVVGGVFFRSPLIVAAGSHETHYRYCWKSGDSAPKCGKENEPPPMMNVGGCIEKLLKGGVSSACEHEVIDGHEHHLCCCRGDGNDNLCTDKHFRTDHVCTTANGHQRLCLTDVCYTFVNSADGVLDAGCYDRQFFAVDLPPSAKEVCRKVSDDDKGVSGQLCLCPHKAACPQLQQHLQLSSTAAAAAVAPPSTASTAEDCLVTVAVVAAVAGVVILVLIAVIALLVCRLTRSLCFRKRGGEEATTVSTTVVSDPLVPSTSAVASDAPGSARPTLPYSAVRIDKTQQSTAAPAKVAAVSPLKGKSPRKPPPSSKEQQQRQKTATASDDENYGYASIAFKEDKDMRMASDDDPVRSSMILSPGDRKGTSNNSICLY